MREDLESNGSHRADLEALLADIGTAKTTTGRWLSKSDIIGLLSSMLHDGTESAFAQIRAAAKGSGFIGKIPVYCKGERRGTRYAFGERPAEKSAQRVKTATPSSRGDVLKARPSRQVGTIGERLVTG